MRSVMYNAASWLLLILFSTTTFNAHSASNEGWFEVTKGMRLSADSVDSSLPFRELNPPARTSWEIREFSDESRAANSKEPARSDLSNNVDKQALRNSQAATIVKTINVDMFAGEVKVMGRVQVTRVAVGNGDIVRAEVLKSGELLVIGQSAGSTSLRLWHTDKTQSDFNIRVSDSDPETRIRMETMVRMRVRMIEFRKSALGKLGIDWSDSAAGPGFAVAGDLAGNNLFRRVGEGFAAGLPNTVKPFSTYFGVASNITSRINFLASTGDATTLAEPVLSTTSGGSASFLAGGEVPYPSVGANGQTIVQFKEYGIKLNVSPSIDALGNVRTVVETEISQLDPAVSVQGAPGLLTRKARTQVNVRSGETIVISGLLSSESSKDIDKLPGIGNLPIIGSFFRTQNARNTVSELVIFVTPEIVEPVGAALTSRQQEYYEASEHRVTAARQKIQLLD
jgi:pilus assembly protein CpaC